MTIAKKRREYWNRCDNCGKFIAIKEFDKEAIRIMITPDTAFSSETYKTLCKKCVKEFRDLGLLYRRIP